MPGLQLVMKFARWQLWSKFCIYFPTSTTTLTDLLTSSLTQMVPWLIPLTWGRISQFRTQPILLVCIQLWVVLTPLVGKSFFLVVYISTLGYSELTFETLSDPSEGQP